VWNGSNSFVGGKLSQQQTLLQFCRVDAVKADWGNRSHLVAHSPYRAKYCDLLVSWLRLVYSPKIHCERWLVHSSPCFNPSIEACSPKGNIPRWDIFGYCDSDHHFMDRRSSNQHNLNTFLWETRKELANSLAKGKVLRPTWVKHGAIWLSNLWRSSLTSLRLVSNPPNRWKEKKSDSRGIILQICDQCPRITRVSGHTQSALSCTNEGLCFAALSAVLLSALQSPPATNPAFLWIRHMCKQGYPRGRWVDCIVRALLALDLSATDFGATIQQ
jgi:hypothetical protein